MADSQFHPFTPVSPAVVDALLRCNRAATQGFEQLTKHWIDTARQTFESGVEQQRRLSGINSLTDFAAWQGQVAQDSFQNLWARSREFSDLGTTVARELMSSLTDVATETTSVAADQATSKANGGSAKQRAA
eukprot:TRINITY_DN40441_c0_g1_i1.p1 TRINITY_DN40441_c0_g1~~TRINITY_DN40441_c0_g1_i1.p1  ORF type:complete len:132 (+),score=18.89 TRINITY_DN40441_c0_g1_i1:288-683(+)